MHRFYTAGSSPTPPPVPENRPFPNSYPAQEAIVDAYWFHAVTEELGNIVRAAGMALDVEQTNQCAAAIQSMIAAAGVGTPTGAVLDFAGTVAPEGYLLCDGSAVSRTTYAALFAVIGTVYGPGDGATTFNLPDYRGRVGVGKDDMGGAAANRVTAPSGATLGGSGGAEKHTLTIQEMPAHSHTVTKFTGGEDGGARDTLGGGGSHPTSSVGGGQPHNNMQPYITINKIIKT